MKRLMMSAVIFAAVGCVFAADSTLPPNTYTQTVNMAAAPLRDLRESTCFPMLGVAGSMMEGDLNQEYMFVSNRAETARMFKRCGTYFTREWDALNAWRRNMAWAKLKTPEEREAFRKLHRGAALVDPMEVFKFRKENHVRTLFTLEQWSVLDPKTGKANNDVIAVREAVREFVHWIVANGFKEEVAGFELGNESYFDPHPDQIAERWNVILPAVYDEWPDAKVGIPLAEYAAGDPDLKAVRNRMLSTGTSTLSEKDTFDPSRMNAWSGHFIMGMSNYLDRITHIIYHFYGGDVTYGAGWMGFSKIETFMKVMPEVANKKVWLTEVRERSDEDNRCHQMFFSTIWKAHYFQLALSRPYFDGVNIHSCEQLSGMFYIAYRGSWSVQWDSRGREYEDPDDMGVPRITEGPAGCVYRLYNEAILTHPLYMTKGNEYNQGISNGVWRCSMMYEQRQGAAGVDWTLLLSEDKKSAALLMVNSDRENRRTIRFTFPGKKMGEMKREYVSCPADHYRTHTIPGEPPPWYEHSDTLPAPNGDTFDIPVDPLTVQTVVFPIN